MVRQHIHIDMALSTYAFIIAEDILWEQMAIFNKRIGFIMWIKNLCVQYILWRILTIKSMFDVANMLKTFTVKDMPVNNYEFLNIQASSFIVWVHPLCSQTLVLNC